MKKIILLAALLLTALGVLTACGEEMERQVVEYRWVMDTRIAVQVFYYGTDSARLERQHRAIASEAADLAYKFDRLFDRFNEESDIWRINNAGGEYVEVDNHTIQVLEHALYFRELTGGSFDVTVGALMNLWDFGFYTEGLLPTQEDIDIALQTVGTNIYIDGNRVRLGNPDAVIDLGGIGKGYAADYVAEFLRSHDVVGIVNFFGDIMLVGDRPGGGLWGVGIGDPFEEILILDTYAFSLWVPGETAVVTSGTTARGFIYEGRRFHHKMDVTTGWPVNTPMASVTVVAENVLWGEALTTALYTMDGDDFWELITSLDNVYVAVIDEQRQIFMSPGMGAYGDEGTVIPIRVHWDF